MKVLKCGEQAIYGYCPRYFKETLPGHSTQMFGTFQPLRRDLWVYRVDLKLKLSPEL